MTEITSEALNSIRLRCEARMPFQSSEVLSLITKVERLRNELLVLTGVPDENKRLRAEVLGLQTELSAVDSALGGTPTVVWDNSPTRAESIRELGEEVRRLRAERQWQPMETAPRDGAPIMLWNGYGTLIGYWGCRSQCWLGSASCDNPKLKEVTHWMPLPKPPEQKA